MNKKLCLVALMLLITTSIFASWIPSLKYANWVDRFEIDKTWKFENASGEKSGDLHTGVSTVEFPGTIAWCFMSWNNRNDNNDDHDMEYIVLYLRNGSDNNDSIQIAYVTVTGGDDKHEPKYNYTTYQANGNKTWYVQSRKYGYKDGSWIEYMVTEYSSKTREFIERVGSNLQLVVLTRWDDNSWNTYEKSAVIDSSDRQLISAPSKPTVSDVAWVVNDGQTAVKYSRTVPSGCNFRIKEKYNGKYYGQTTSDKTGTSATEYFYPFQQSKYPAASSMSNAPVSFVCYSDKVYSMNQDYYKWHPKSSRTLTSEETSFNTPQFAQVRNLKLMDNNDGTIGLSWMMDACTGTLRDESKIVIDCATDANFTQDVRSTEINYVNTQTSYSTSISFSEREVGSKAFYIRAYRKNSSNTNSTLTVSKNITVNTNYARIISLDGEVRNGKPVLKWKFQSGVSSSDMLLKLTYAGIEKTLNLTDAMKMTEYEITDAIEPCETFDYTAQVLVKNAAYGDEQKIALMVPRSIGSNISSVSISKGFYNDRVSLRWQVDEEHYDFSLFQIGRRVLGSTDQMVMLGSVDFKSGVFAYAFEDVNCVPGVYYQYYVLGYTNCDDHSDLVHQISSIGFAQPYGVVSGQITYSGNQGVPDVAVSVMGEDVRRSRSLRFLAKDNATLTFTKDMWQQMTGDEGTIEFYLLASSQASFLPVQVTLENGKFNHVAYTYNTDSLKAYVNGELVSSKSISSRPFADGFTFGGNNFAGFVDEIRVWNICRSQAELQRTMNIYLAGSEDGLTGYYRCDDAVENELFDISRTGTTFHEHHLQMCGIVPDPNNIPSADQLSLKAYTDKDGNYLINNVPYTVDGSLYSVIPTLGVHEFSPATRPLFFNRDAATHNSIDFTDESSFEVTGKVTYDNTNYPVVDCQFYVDGQVCSTDGNVIKSDEEGNFTIQVPIGEHFIRVEKDGHTFVNGGRYPADPDGAGIKALFDAPRTNLCFYDNTTVLVVGRVAGGEDEQNKSHGFELGKANIGQARIVLTPPEDLYNLNLSTTEGRTFFCPDTISCNSSASTGVANGNSAHSITIITDPVTGEFAVALPPVDFEIRKIEVPANPAIQFDLGQFENLTLGSGNIRELTTDTLFTDSVNYKLVSYMKKIDAIHFAVPELRVSQYGMPNGALGETTYYINLPSGMVDTIPMFTITNGALSYTMGAPAFLQGNAYAWKIKAFETYVNYDDAQHPDTTFKPMREAIVTIENELGEKQVAEDDGFVVDEKGDSTMVAAGEIIELEKNQVMLDSLGEADYVFVVGQPNIVAPYTYNVNINYSDADQTRLYSWSENGQCKGLIFGARTSGTNFVTEGPDRLLFVLRDPPGAKSFATWEKGEKIAVTSSVSNEYSRGTEGEHNVLTGLNEVIGVGVGVINITAFKQDNTIGWADAASGVTTKTSTQTYELTTNQTISTKAESPYVGTVGDVFVGAGTNVLFGNARQVTLERMTDNPVSYQIVVKDVISTGSVFKTTFNYTTKDIEEKVIPNYIKQRNALLQHVDAAAYNTDYPNFTSEQIYITTLSPDDPRYGSDNDDESVWGSAASAHDSLGGPSYLVIPPSVWPDTMQGVQDLVYYYNEQVRSWQNILAENEKNKVIVHHSSVAFNSDDFEDDPEEYDGGWLLDNVSLGGGVTVASASTQTTSKGKSVNEKNGLKVMFKTDFGIQVKSYGFSWKNTTYVGYNRTKVNTTTQTQTSAIKYTLALNSYEYMSIDVYAAPDGFGPIFATRGGQTYCPYEKEERTKYFEPGEHEIQTATVAMEQPQILADQTTITDVPIGGKAIFTLNLSNLADVNPNSFTWLKFYAAGDHNPHGARMSVDGAVLTETGRLLKFYPSQPITKTLIVEQEDLGVLDYEKLAVVLSSDCNTKTADTLWLSAHFVPTCSDIHLKIDNTTINTTTGDTLPVTINGYDRNFRNLKALRLQYRHVGDNDWHLVREFSTNPDDTIGGQKSLIDGAAIYYSIVMTDTEYPDGQYEFRAVTACTFGNEEIPNESEIIVVTKDMQRPVALGLPSPVNGIYAVDNQIYVDLNEPIQAGRVRDKDISVTGVLNAHNVDDHAVALQLTKSGAYSNADYNLDGSSFTLEFWFNYTKSCTLFGHATGTDMGMRIAVSSSRLAIYFGNQAITSKKITVPENKWCFLTVEYYPDETADDKGYITAHCAYDSEEIVLIEPTRINRYDMRGNIVLGGSGECKLHDVAIWNSRRDWRVSLSERNKRKDAYTDGLLSYWPMDDGEDLVARDIIRGRDLQVPQLNSWWYNNNNIALAIPAGQVAQMPLAECPVAKGEDFVFECWFRMEHDGTLFCLSDSALCVNFVGQTLQLTLKEKTADWEHALDERIEKTWTIDCGKVIADGGWHHFALNYRHSTLPVFMIDGKLLDVVNLSDMPAFAATSLVFSSNNAAGEVDIDEVRLWNAYLMPQNIVLNKNSELRGDENGLLAYYPMSEDTVDEANQPVILFSLADKVSHNTLTCADAQAASTQPALRKQRPTEVVKHTYTPSAQRIVINVTESAARIEGCTLEFEVSNLVDEQGNYSNPIRWTTYVNRNQLVWNEESMRIVKTALKDTTITLTIVNNSGKAENWYINNVPDWMEVSESAGILQPLQKKQITATILGSLAIGNYERTLYLVGDEEVMEPLRFTIRVNAEKPDWYINPADYEYSMSMFATATVNSDVADDSEDMLAAFIGNQLAGVTSPQLLSSYSRHYIIMDIYANLTQAEKDSVNHGLSISKQVTFKYWDASTGRIYTSVGITLPESKIKNKDQLLFVGGKLVGTLKSPVRLAAGTVAEQSVALTKGWNWISFNVLPEDVNLSAVLKDMMNNITIIKSQDEFAQVNAVRDSLRGSLKVMDCIKGYKMHVNSPYEKTICGSVINPLYVGIPISGNGKWTWIGYLPQMSLDVNTALANINPTEGDIIKAQTGFAMWDGYQWIGSLRVMSPSNAYLYCNVGAEDITLYYPSLVRAEAPRYIAPVRQAPSSLSSFTPVDPGTYSGNMTLTAVVMNGTQVVNDAEVAVFAGDECRAVATADDGLWFITIPGDKSETLTIQVATQETVINCKQQLTYIEDAMIGTCDQPYIIQIGDEDALEHVEGKSTVYKVLKDQNVYIIKDNQWFNVLGIKTK